MPENNNKKKGSKKQQEQNISINVEGQEVEQASRNRGLFKSIVNFIKGICSATIDMPQKGQSGSREKSTDQQKGEIQGEWLISSKVDQEIEQGTTNDPKNLSPEKKQEVEKAGKVLKKGLKQSNAGNQSIEVEAPDQTPAQDIDSSKGVKR